MQHSVENSLTVAEAHRLLIVITSPLAYFDAFSSVLQRLPSDKPRRQIPSPYGMAFRLLVRDVVLACRCDRCPHTETSEPEGGGQQLLDSGIDEEQCEVKNKDSSGRHPQKEGVQDRVPEKQ